MNDLGLEAPIEEAGHNVDSTQVDGMDERAAERQYLDPSRWWFASTACPLIAGTFGPTANAFNICAISTYWRQTILPGGDEASAVMEPDPPWLLAINALSLLCALIANAALLLNMANKTRFEVALPITIFGFYLAAFLLIALLGAASTESFYHPGQHALTGAFYYAVWAAVLYMVVASILLLTVWGALTGKYKRQFSLTTSQRTLMLQTISFLVYLFLGALIFGRVEHWDYLEAVYWADFTLLTIGIGSPLTPQTHTGKSLLIPYAIGGIITVGLIINSIRSMLIDTGKEKMKARATEKMRKRVHSYVDVDNHRPGPLPDSKHFVEREDLSQKERRRREFYAMRQIQERALSKNRWTSLLLSGLAGLVLWLIGALVFKYTEYKQDWTYFVALYFSYTTLLTIGYGDFQPVSNSGRAFFVLWTFMAIPTLTILISDMGDTVVKSIANATIWLGNLTILPSQAGTWSDWRENVAGVIRRLSTSSTAVFTDLRRSEKLMHDERSKGDYSEIQDIATTLRSRLSTRDITHCSSLSNDRQLYRWLLVKEVNALSADKNSLDDKKYNYDEWSYFLNLLGHDEDKVQLHQRPNPPPRRESNDEVQLGRPIDQHGNIKPWSWMGIRSPLMSPKDDVDWLLQHLLAQLQREMENSGDPVIHERTRLPVSLSMIMPARANSESSGTADVKEAV